MKGQVNKMDAIILASSSGRRELLSLAGIPFRVMPGEVDEGAWNLTGRREMANLPN